MKKEETKALTQKRKKINIIDIIKKRWLINRTNTLLLIIILIAIFIFINSIIKSLKLTPIDCTANKEHTLTEESKNRIKNISKDINIYFTGIDESNTAYTLSQQYSKTNSKIHTEIIDLNKRADIAQKYNVDSSTQVIIVEAGEKSKVIGQEELLTYDSNYQTVDLTEEKITSALINVASDKIAKVYFLTTYSNLNFEYGGGLFNFSQYLNDEVLEYEPLDILIKGNIPDDCSTLVVLPPTKDFDELTVNEITKYINNGGNILWFNNSYAQKIDLPNVNKILDLYGINPFDEGYIYETNKENTALNYASSIVYKLGLTQVDKKLKDALLLNSTKINCNTEKLEEKKVTKTDLLKTSSTAYFRKDVSNESTSTDGDEQGEFIVAGIFKKIISEGDNKDSQEDDTASEMIIFGDVNFITDLQIAQNISPMIFINNNKDLALNSIAYLTDQDEDITIRKDYNSSASQFTATDEQKAIIMRIIFTVPIAIIIFGIIVWQVRRRKK